jgi:hypothetical protein
MKTVKGSLNEGSLFVLDDGIHEWRNKVSQRHRDDGPAIVKPDGTQEWYIKGLRHRLNNPAVIYPDGHEEWWVNGKRHRLDGPAVTYPNGTKAWWQNGLRHRDNGPAIESSLGYWAEGSKQWYQNGLKHRLDGPAVVVTDGRIEWWQLGEKLPFVEYKKTIIRLAVVFCGSDYVTMKGLPFSEVESLLYAFNGWVKNFDEDED